MPLLNPFDNLDNDSNICPRMRKAGVTNPNSQQAQELCLTCPLPDCSQTNYTDDLVEEHHIPVIEECFVQCQVCKAMETLTFVDGVLEKTVHWYQKGDTIYHLRECGKAKII